MVILFKKSLQYLLKHCQSLDARHEVLWHSDLMNKLKKYFSVFISPLVAPYQENELQTRSYCMVKHSRVPQ